jgi:hypothetical protein
VLLLAPSAGLPCHTHYLPKGVILLTGPAEPTGAQVTAVLETLAQEHVTGVLEIDGSPAGTVYFEQGEITFARASWIPDLSARLRGALRPAGKLNDLLDSGDRPDFDIGDILIRHGLITRDGLAEILRSVVIDTLIVLTAAPSDGASVSDIRFQAPGSHWAGAFSRLDVTAAAAEAAGWAKRIARYGLARSTPVALRDLDGSCAVLTREHWEIAATMDHPLSAQDLAWQHGLALYDVIERVGGLVQAGLCMLRDNPLATPARPARTPSAETPAARTPAARAPAARASSALSQSAGTMPARIPPAEMLPASGPLAPTLPAGAAPGGLVLPRRDSSRGDRPAGAQRLPGGPRADGNGNGTAPGPTPAAAPELLRRVLDGLRDLS